MTLGRGTVLLVFQPGEETAKGAQSIIDDRFFECFPKPIAILGQHAMPSPAGIVSYRLGVTQAAADSLEVRRFRRGADWSMSEVSVDPVVRAERFCTSRDRPGRRGGDLSSSGAVGEHGDALAGTGGELVSYAYSGKLRLRDLGHLPSLS